jgi:hypothetical protein
MRVAAKSASAVVLRTLEQAIVASGHTLSTPQDAELVVHDQLHAVDATAATSACMTFSTATSPSVHALSLPVNLAQLLRALRTVQSSQPLPLANGWTLDLTERRAIRADGASLSFTEKECELLTALRQLAPESMTREALLAKVWGMRHDVDTHTLETHIYRLRQKLASQIPSPGDILTEGGTYRIILDE